MHDRRGRVVYQCNDASHGGKRCFWRAGKPLEELIEETLFQAVESDEWDRQPDRPADDPTRPHYEAATRITAELDVLDGMLAEAELTERLGGKAEPSAAMIRRKIAEREQEREHHQTAAARLRRGRVVAAVPRNLREVWPSLSLDRKRAILAAVLKLPPEGRGIVVHPYPPGVDSRVFRVDSIEADWRG
jgi:hypothetical protein